MRAFLHLRSWLLAGVLLASAGMPAAAADSARESAVRAALIFNFIKFTEWSMPRASDQPIQVCIASDDAELYAAVEALGSGRVRGKAIHVARYKNPVECDVVYVDTRLRWKGMAEPLAAQPVLTIGTYAGFVDEGGMIEVDIRESGSRFDVNLPKAKRAGLRFYPQFLQLARRVVE